MITPAIQSKKAHATSAVGAANLPQIRFLRLPKVLEKTGLSKTTVYTLPDFPRPVKIKAGAGLQGGARWVESEIDEWMQSLIQLRDSRTSARADMGRRCLAV